MALPQIITVAAIGWIGFQLFSKKGKKTSKGSSNVANDPPALDCGLYRWKPVEVDLVLVSALEDGERDPERLALVAARAVYPTTPEGGAQPWPPRSGDMRGLCVLDRIRIRANLRLAEWVDDAVDDEGPGGSDPDEPLPSEPPTGPAPPGPPKPTPPGPTSPPDGPGIKPPTRPEEPHPTGPSDPVGPQWPDYPPAGPVDLEPWTDPGNYPTPRKFHQVGGPHSATTLQAIARKALTTAFYVVHGDLETAIALANESANWRAYREAINCSPWNHALYGSVNRPGSSGAYDTPHGDTISMFPVHADVFGQLTRGEVPQRRVREDRPSLPAGGRHAFLWLPPLDEVALLEGRVEIKREHWSTGDWVVMPPPEVLALGVVDVPPGRMWGCGGYETSYDYEEAS